MVNLFKDVIIKNLQPDHFQLLEETLVKCAINREMIKTTETTRGLGKSTTLINFARKYDLLVIVGGKYATEALTRETKYDQIYYVQSPSLKSFPSGTKVVVDEMVNIDEVRSMGLDVVTGYVYERH